MTRTKNTPLLALSAGAALVGLLATPAHATLFAYEGFEFVSLVTTDGGPLAGTPYTQGVGFSGSWVATNGTGAASTINHAGLSYPASYPGTFTAVGGNGRVTGATGANAFLALGIDPGVATSINSSPVVYISWLAQNVGQTVTAAGVLDDATRTTFNLASEYPRNFGLRLMDGSTSNSTFGIIGGGSTFDGSGGGAPVQSAYGDAELNPEVVDTWGAAGFNDVNNIFTGNGGTQAGPGSAFYNPAPAHYDGVDHLVLRVDTVTSNYRLWVNPKADGSSDGSISWVHTNGGTPVPFNLGRIGVEGGNDSSNRPVGDMIFDEIRIASTFDEAAGFVPEPSVALLGAFGLLGLLRRRRN